MAALEASLTADWRDLPRALPLAPPIRAAPRLVVFLDYDGTLTPIVAHSSLAVLAESMRAALRRLADKATARGPRGTATRRRAGIGAPHESPPSPLDVDGPWTGRGAAAAAAWIFCGGGRGRRIGRICSQRRNRQIVRAQGGGADATKPQVAVVSGRARENVEALVDAGARPA